MKLQFSASNPSLIITDRFGLTSRGCWEAQGENFRSALCVERAHTVSQFMTSPGTKLKNNKSCPLTSSPDNNEQTRESANTHRTSLSLMQQKTHKQPHGHQRWCWRTKPIIRSGSAFYFFEQRIALSS
jgi:hypothetical protein